MLQSIIVAALGLLFPNAPAWIGKMLGLAVPVVIEAVRELTEADDMPGADKYTLVVIEVGRLLDEAMDDIPAWSELTEEQRDRIIGGLVELALFIERAADTPKGQKNVLRAIRKARRQLGL